MVSFCLLLATFHLTLQVQGGIASRSANTLYSSSTSLSRSCFFVDFCSSSWALKNLLKITHFFGAKQIVAYFILDTKLIQSINQGNLIGILCRGYTSAQTAKSIFIKVFQFAFFPFSLTQMSFVSYFILPYLTL